MAYALLISLKHSLELLLDPGRSRIQVSSSELQPFYEDLCYLKSFFDKVKSLEDSISVEEVEKDIKDVLQNSRNLMESHLSDLVRSGSERSGDGSWFSRELVELKDNLRRLSNMLKAKENDLIGKQQLPTDVAVGVDVAVVSEIHQEIVGLEDEVRMLRQRLLDPDSRLQLVYIVGMFGIGKTTLAKEVCNDEYIRDKFTTRGIVRIGVEYKLEELLRELCEVLMGSEVKEKPTVHELGNRLKASLSGGTYLVVLDELWNMRVWDHLRPYFPDDGNGSRIVITTRMTNVDRVAYRKSIFQKRLLDDHESWELFCNMAFSGMECPSELEGIGKEIVLNMGGHPSALVEIGKCVSELPKTVESWMEYAQNIIWKTTIPKVVNAELPHHLKACLLYLGLLLPNYNIPASQLIKLWVAEGFIEPDADQNLDSIAEEYLEDLVSRGLVIVHERSYTGRIKTCGMIHKLIRDVCVTEAQQQKIFCIVNKDTSTKKQRRVSIQSDALLGMMAVSPVRSLVFMCAEHQDPLPVFKCVKWLRVLHALPIRFSKFPDQILKLVRLRYLAITFDGELPSSISTLWDLQVLIIVSSRAISSPVFLPLEIWELQKLRHLHCMGFDLPLPSADLHLMKLLTLSGVSFRTCVDGVLARIPNLTKLRIQFDPAVHAVEISSTGDVSSHLHRLESFKCAVTNPSGVAFSLEGFPSGLTKLTLGRCGFLWDEHSAIIIDQLPDLQVLKLRWNAFCGPRWEFGDAVYHSLKLLVLEDLSIEQLKAEPKNLPVLQKLVIRRCYYLKEIPSDMIDILTLKVIEVDDCGNSLVKSARLIQEEQADRRNDDLQVTIHSSSDDSK
ncbi:putative late blight resistance protein homolog R1A-10 isoform X2 [Salvia splendens]|uniref:putative late blight resistance protein homolog R1A-10 isoform X2 n=1 Tax=Salvia splendens TaxID=180675 RepID=UPI001C27C022|nr:putative late blight resistance protein homolog R1A-10 isoform X2 [Salvia splendens]